MGGDMKGNCLKQIREGRGITQEGLAAALGVSCSTVQKWEHGTREFSGKWLKELASYLDCSVDEILNISPTSFVQTTFNIGQMKVLRLCDSLNDSNRSKWIEYGELLRTAERSARQVTGREDTELRSAGSA